MLRCRSMPPPSLTDLARTGVRTARAFGTRIPGAGAVLARSLEDAVGGRIVMITGASSGIGNAAAAKIGRAGGTVLLVARTEQKLRDTADQIERRGGTAYAYPCNLTDPDDIDRMAAEVLEHHGQVDVIVNNAGKSIRRSIGQSYDRFHDFQRTMILNYFGPVKLLLDLIRGMCERGSGHIVNFSTIVLQTNVPRYAAYVASKAALDAFSRSVAAEVIADGVHFTTVYMPLVRSPMIAPSRVYDRFPTLSPEEAAELIAEAIRKRPKRVATPVGNLSQLNYALVPGVQDLVVNRAFKLFEEGISGDRQTAEQKAFIQATRGVHW